jgi:alanine-synthesizing transaminase
MSGFLAGADLSVNRIEQARQRASARGFVDLTSSNPTRQGLLFPPNILREAAGSYWEARSYTPDPRGATPARAAIARYYAERRATSCAADDIFITASTSEAYALLFALLAEPGDNVLAPNVTYPLFEHLAEVHHVELRSYDLEESRGWAIDGASLLAAADARTRAVLLVSPHNPTGMILQRPIAELNSLNLPLICDEVFAEFVHHAPRTPTISELHPALPSFTLNGVSKLFALPDLKLGWVAMNKASSTQYAGRLEILNDAFLSANSLTQHMLPALFEHGWGFVDAMRVQVNRQLGLALEILAQCPALDAREPDGGYYLFPRVRGWNDEEALVLHLLESGVLVHPGYFYGLDADESGAHIMISCLTEGSQLREGLRRLCAAL